MNLVGQRALLLYPAGLDFIAAFFGCLYAGVVAVPAYPPRRNRSLSRIEAIADDSEAKIALTTFPVWERVQGLSQIKSPEFEKTGLALHRSACPHGLEDQWQSCPTCMATRWHSCNTRLARRARPRGSCSRHANLMHNSASISYAFEHTRGGSGVFWLPSYHDMGLDRRDSATPIHRPGPTCCCRRCRFTEALSLAEGHLALSLAQSAAGPILPTIFA